METKQMEKKFTKDWMIEQVCKIFTLGFLFLFIFNIKFITEFSFERQYYYPIKDIFKTLLGMTYSFSTFQLGLWIVNKYFVNKIKDERKPGETKDDVIQ